MKNKFVLTAFILFCSGLLILAGVRTSSAGVITNLIKSLFTKEATTATREAAINGGKKASKSEATNSTGKGLVNSGERAATRTVGGSSAVLGARIGIKKNGERAEHHLIPSELKDHPVLNKVGMDLDEAPNGIALPTKPGVDPNLPLHTGSHRSYTAAVAAELDSIPTNLTVAETRARIIAIQNKFRKMLESGKPLHARYGAPNPWY
jgi:hypothetical protein